LFLLFFFGFGVAVMVIIVTYENRARSAQLVSANGQGIIRQPPHFCDDGACAHCPKQ
jgi:hypothetical protein